MYIKLIGESQPADIMYEKVKTCVDILNDQKNRVNLFQDDGTIASDVTTPDFTPTNRTRSAYEPVEQTCQRCNKTSTINPKHAREFFVCDRCLSK